MFRSALFAAHTFRICRFSSTRYYNKNFNTTKCQLNDNERPPFIRYKTAKKIVYAGVALVTAYFGYLAYLNFMGSNRVLRVLHQTKNLKYGGPFDLVDHNGNPFTEKDLGNKFSIFYFGFVHCPDICPQTLERITEIFNQLRIAPKYVEKYLRCVFVTVDPERDTPQLVKQYIKGIFCFHKDFHPLTIGLTGTREQIDHMKEAYRVYGKISIQATDTDYIVDHSVALYLVGPDGIVLSMFSKDNDPKKIARDLQIYISDYLKQKKGKFNYRLN